MEIFMSFKKVALLLGIVILPINSMEVTKEQKINWEERKKEYLNWGFYKPLNTEEYWVPLRKGIESKEIKFEPIVREATSNSETNFDQNQGFLAHQGPVDVESGKAILLYPSPLWMYATLVMSDKITEVYAASSKGDTSFKSLAFEKVLKESLPKGLEINESYLPGWKDNPNIVLWYNNKLNSHASKTTPDIQFKKMSLKNDEDTDSEKNDRSSDYISSSSSSSSDDSSDESNYDSSSNDNHSQIACGIQPLPRNENDENLSPQPQPEPNLLLIRDKASMDEVNEILQRINLERLRMEENKNNNKDKDLDKN